MMRGCAVGGRCSSKREVFVFVLCFVEGFLMHEMDGAPGWLVGWLAVKLMHGKKAVSLRAGTRNLEPLFRIIRARQ